MNLAFQDLYGIADILDGISLSGRTDDTILMDAYVKAGLEFSYSELSRFKSVYFNAVKCEITSYQFMPGIETLVPMLAEREDISLGLLTGNWQTSARIKMNAVGFNSFFTYGAFSDDSPHRHELVPVALSRFQALYGYQPRPQDVWVIGDTPADIQCAKPHGVVSVAVAAAGYNAEELGSHQPDILLDDMTDFDGFLKLLGQNEE